MIEGIALGDYVLATKYSDGDPDDHWALGYYAGSTAPHYNPPRYDVVDASGQQFRGNGFRRIAKVLPEVGTWLLEHADTIRLSGRSVWDFALAPFARGEPTLAPLDEPSESFILLQRLHDHQRDEWSEWKEITGEELCGKYGTTVEDWKQNARGWIDMGGAYEYKIVLRLDTPVWALRYKNKNETS